MNQKKFAVWLIGVLGGAVVLGLVIGMSIVRPRVNQAELIENPKTETVSLQVGDTSIQVEIRDDDAERSLGLSGRETLGEDEGMLFVFEQVGRPVFWMKDMLIDLDVVWIKDGEVVGVQEQIPAPSDEDPIIKTMTPAVEVDSVLELPAGFVQANEIRLGDTVIY